MWFGQLCWLSRLTIHVVANLCSKMCSLLLQSPFVIFNRLQMPSAVTQEVKLALHVVLQGLMGLLRSHTNWVSEGAASGWQLK